MKPVGPKDTLAETEEVDPHREGWVTDDGELYIFPPGRREVLVRIKVQK